MKVVTYNIKCDPVGLTEADWQRMPASLRRNSFAARQQLIEEKLRAEQPDIIGFQETQPHMIRWLKEHFPDYIFMGNGREKDLSGETMLLGVKKNKFDLWGLSTVWLSPDPYVPGSRYEDQSSCPRTCLTALLRTDEFPFPIRVYLTHLDHESVSARYKGLNQILRQMEDDTDRLLTPCILMGDMNAEPGDMEFEPIRQYTSLALRDVTKDVGPTFHDFGEGVPSKIDYIFVTEPFRAVSACRWHEEKDGIFLSDHDPVCALLK